MKITGDMKILEIVEKWPNTVNTFIEMSMGCGSCGASHYETIEEGAMAHGYLPSEILNKLNDVITEKK